MRINSVLDIFGAIILLAIVATVVAHPKVVSTVGTTFTGAIQAAKG